MEKKEMKGGVFNECLLINIFPTECPHEQGGGWSTKCRQLQTGGEGGSKITNNVRTSFMDGPQGTADQRHYKKEQMPHQTLLRKCKWIYYNDQLKYPKFAKYRSCKYPRNNAG